MRNTLTAWTFVGLVGLGATPSAAQDRANHAPVPVEMGGNVALIGGRYLTVGPRVTVSFRPRHAIELGADFGMDRGPSSSWAAFAFVILQYRYTLPLHFAQTRVFLKAGAAGSLVRSHRDAYTLTFGGTTHDFPAQTWFKSLSPSFPTGGIGFQRAVGNRVAFGGDTSLVIGPGGQYPVVYPGPNGVVVSFVGLRASGGIVVLLGR